jgi:hypothetical protein
MGLVVVGAKVAAPQRGPLKRKRRPRPPASCWGPRRRRPPRRGHLGGVFRCSRPISTNDDGPPTRAPSSPPFHHDRPLGTTMKVAAPAATPNASGAPGSHRRRRRRPHASRGRQLFSLLPPPGTSTAAKAHRGGEAVLALAEGWEPRTGAPPRPGSRRTPAPGAPERAGGDPQLDRLRKRAITYWKRAPSGGPSTSSSVAARWEGPPRANPSVSAHRPP